ncbi:MAG: hypothetical protein ACI8W1_001864 [Candidatus Azotimanducaceae bacterium]|jgi:hypothetical protein
MLVVLSHTIDLTTLQPVDFQAVTPLIAGPSMVLAEVVPESEWLINTRGTACTAGVQ